MSTSVDGFLAIALNLTYSAPNVNSLGTPKDAVNLGATPYQIAGATGSTYMMTKHWPGTVPLLASTPQTLDLTNLVGGLGAVSFTKVNLLWVLAPAGVAGAKTVLGDDGGSNTWVGPFGTAIGTLDAPQGCPLCLTNLLDGWAVDSTHKVLQLNPGTHAQAVQVYIGGN